jgi:hypothetical protein
MAPQPGRLVVNFPQAFSYVALVNTAHNLAPAKPPDKREDIMRPGNHSAA